MILAVDTSLAIFSVALLSESRVLGGVMLEGKESRNEKLLPAIDWILGLTSTELRMVQLLAVTRGPGSFTGVRVGLATIQGLALALGIPVCAISTHEAALHGETESGRVIVHNNAGRGEWYATEFEDGRPLSQPQLVSSSELVHLSSAARALNLEELVLHTNLAILTAGRAQRILKDGLLESYAQPTPIYVRLAEAEVKLQGKLLR